VSEGNYSLKEMRTYYLFWIYCCSCFWVGRKLLSERDENSPSDEPNIWRLNACRKETTLWKRWEHTCYHPWRWYFHRQSEGNYSLKEMRTILPPSYFTSHAVWVGRKLLSERDENRSMPSVLIVPSIIPSEGNYSLKEMRTRLFQLYFQLSAVLSEGNYSLKEMRTRWDNLLYSTRQSTRRKETTLWKRWERE